MKKEICGHPELFPTQWEQKRPEPAEMVGTCEHNMSCPVCGWGWGSYPDHCDDEPSKKKTKGKPLFGQNIKDAIKAIRGK